MQSATMSEMRPIQSSIRERVRQVHGNQRSQPERTPSCGMEVTFLRCLKAESTISPVARQIAPARGSALGRRGARARTAVESEDAGGHQVMPPRDEATRDQTHVSA